jgi:outer membrane protein assembly factor BamB
MESRPQVEQRWESPVEGEGLDLRAAGDGSLIAVGSDLQGSGQVALLDRGGKQLWKYITREPIRNVAVSDVGGFVAAGCDDSQVYFFDRRGLLLWRYKCDQRIRAIAVSRDGNVLAAGSEDQGVYYFDNRNTPRRFVWKLRMEGVVNAVAMVPSGENVLAGAGDGGIYFMDAREGTVMWKAFARAPVLCVATSKFGDLMAAGSEDGSLHCFDLGGRLLWERQTAGAILDVSVDNRGAFVAALSRDGALYFFDARTGALLWSHPTGSEGGKVRLTRNGDLVFAVTADDRVLCLSADEGLIFDVHAGGRAATIEVTSDSETVLLLEHGAIRAFETKAVFKSLILALRQQILAGRDRGAPIEPALGFEKQAVSALKNFDYKGVHTAVLSAEWSLREGLTRVTEQSAVQRRAAEALVKLRAAAAEASALGFDTAAVRAVAEAADGLARAGDHAKALAVIAEARGKVAELDRRRDGHAKAKAALEAAREALAASKSFEGVATGDAGNQMTLAEAAFAERDFTMAAEYAALASEMAIQARRASPKAIESEVRQIEARIAAGPIPAAEVPAVEAALSSAVAHYQGRRAFKEVAALQELAARAAGANGSGGPVPPAARRALEAAAFAYLDGGDAARASDAAERAADLRTAAKLRERAKDGAGAARVVERMAQEERARREALAAESRKVDEYIGGLVSARRHADAASELLKFERFAEAVSLLEGQRDPVSAAFLLRIYFHTGEWQKLMAACVQVEAGLRDEIARGANELLPFLGRLLVGHGFVAQVVGAQGEQDRLNDMWSFFLLAYERRGGMQAERDLDAAAFAGLIGRGERERVRRAAAQRKGPFFEWVVDAEVMVERGNQKGFRKMLSLYSRDFITRFTHMGSPLKSLHPPGGAGGARGPAIPVKM